MYKVTLLQSSGMFVNNTATPIVNNRNATPDIPYFAILTGSPHVPY